jgi:hypothetical protein
MREAINKTHTMTELRSQLRTSTKGKIQVLASTIHIVTKQRTILTISDGAFKDAAADYEDKQDRRSSHCRKSSANYESKLGCFISKRRRRRKIEPLLHSQEAQHLISAEVRLHSVDSFALRKRSINMLQKQKAEAIECKLSIWRCEASGT